jgi:hypothetical protein
MASAQGTATVDFGSTPSSEATIAVTGQATIQATSLTEAWIEEATSANNDANAHRTAGVVMRVVCESKIAGTGFTIRATVSGASGATGQFRVNWAWSD